MEAILAKSKAGHDKGHIYVIIKEEEEYVYLVDGKLKCSGNPKKKNRKHIQIIEKIPGSVEELLCQKNQPGDLEIRRALKLYERM